VVPECRMHWQPMASSSSSLVCCHQSPQSSIYLKSGQTHQLQTGHLRADDHFQSQICQHLLYGQLHMRYTPVLLHIEWLPCGFLSKKQNNGLMSCRACGICVVPLRLTTKDQGPLLTHDPSRSHFRVYLGPRSLCISW